MAKARPSRPRPLTLRFLTGLAHAHHNASPAQKPACKDLGRNGQSPAITPKATYTPVSDRAGSRSL
ncbi:alpha-galactosidase [Lactobacillus rhamnosus]|uniref:Alpha-galactosidase n=1 Tax=Lacticaseibacillus rhamnosus TaxID=47715 RepID=A0A853J6R3_LACRH|nr:alpha-galactosidase [Lacticaseibacillus rhamnosus]